MNKIIRVLLTIVTLATILTSCKPREIPTEYKEHPKEDIFTKTIHDFDGMHVETLDDQENTNFLVYANGVKEILVGSDVNILVNTDYEALCYTFDNADQDLKGLKPGEVIYARPTLKNPEGIAAKVNRVDIQGDQVTVYSDPIGLADLLEYADVCIDIPLADSQLRMPNTYQMSSTAQAPFSSSTNGTVRINRLANKTFSINATHSHTLNIIKSDISVTGSVAFTLKTVTLEFRFSKEHMQLFCGVRLDNETVSSLNISVGGSLVDYSQTLPAVPIPVSIFTIRLEPTISVHISGEIAGNIAYSETVRKGFNASVSPKGVQMKSVDEIISPGAFTGELSQCEGNMSAGLELRPTLRIGFIGNIYGSLSCSFDVTASADIENQPEEENPDSMHLCDLCFDGDVSATGRVSCGLEIQLLTKTAGKLNEIMDSLLGEGVYDIQQTQPEITLLEKTKKLRDFYLSIPDMDKTDSHFDWGDCPNIRYRTTVTIQTEDRSPASGATVTATFQDQQEEQVIADENGIAVVYLPVGDNKLIGTYEYQTGTTDVAIQKTPTQITMTLKEQELYFIIYYLGYYWTYEDGVYKLPKDDVYFDSSVFPEVEAYLRERYPHAHFLDSGKYNFENRDDIFSYIRLAFASLDDDDLIIPITVSRGMNFDYQYDRYAVAPFNSIVIEIYQKGKRRIYQNGWSFLISYSSSNDGSLHEFLGAQLYNMQTPDDTPIQTNYKYVLDYINDTAGVHKITMGFVENACDYIDAVMEGRYK